ncbi:hypothetical protein KIPB_000417 [Kipferlia bialata]|uniref:RNA-binding protein NOB1 n=1 Tax=Kipferlia bialata TaxID=797122 RepID=A0A391NI47_9EUKA|nr:hypothetical protein KIPB_000417 [Kipferlia bialata]|eukprot:g417.t1
MVPTRVKRLVVDTNAIIHRSEFWNYAEELYTVPEVIAEVRDPASRTWLSQMPVKLTVLSASMEHRRAVASFAKLTGDFRSLAVADMHLVALVRQLDVDCHSGSDSHLRVAPVNKYSNRGKRTALVRPTHPKAKEETTPVVDSTPTQEEVAKEPEVPAVQSEQVVEAFVPVVAEADDGDEEEEVKPVVEETEAVSEISPSTAAPSSPTPAPLESPVAAPAPVEQPRALMLSGDFPMQNVCMQMGLMVMPEDGRVIKRLKTFVTKCFSCSSILGVSPKGKWCPKCGNSTLCQVSLTLDKWGVPHYGNNPHINVKGSKFSLPAPVMGKAGRMPAAPTVAADQHPHEMRIQQERERKAERKAKEGRVEANPFAGAAVSFFTGSINGPTSRLADVTSTPQWEKRNPNVSRKRTNKKKRNRKK